ncbi:MAG: Tellurium resistance [Jatrophihabitantaceae bacterium]
MAIDYRKREDPPISLTKVTLTKTSPQVSLTKQGGQLRVNLNWDSQPASGGGLMKRLTGGGGIDLDLGCLYELTDGSKGVVQALGNAFGRLDAPPYIQLSGDDRSGQNAGGEDLFVNLAHAGQIRRVLVFAIIYQGVASFDLANAVVTLSPASGPAIELRLDERGGSARLCAIALLEGSGGELSVRREVRYIDGSQSALDQAYGWGMNWARGRK